MKPRPSTRALATVASVVLAGTLVAPTASADWTTNAERLVQSAVGGDGHVWVTIDADGTATLSGYVDSSNTRRKVERAALRGDGVVRVIDLISY